MKKIVMLPLDERPCNYLYPQMMPKADFELLLPPREIMGDKKRAGDPQKIAAWLLENIGEADACILSLDTLVYGGIVPSRLHELPLEELLRRAKTVETLREKNPRMKLYLFQLIMRCPDYSHSDEEPDYYDLCGREIHLFGRYTHLEKLGKLTKEDAEDFVRVKEKTAPYIGDYLSRRDKNLAVLEHDLQYIANGTADYFIVPQDDAAVYGFTSMDQMRVRNFLKENSLHLKTAMYPSADDTGLILLGRAVAELSGIRPKIFVHYASTKAEGVVPWFEDRALGETVKYHILAVGGRQVYSLPEADIALCVNMGSGMFHGEDPGYVQAYDVDRNLGEFVNFIEYALGCGKLVAVGDVAACNGADVELLRLLDREGLLLKLHAYAGWNTSSNTLGTAVCQSVLYLAGKDDAGRISFLLHRYYEDAGYMAHTRKYVTEKLLPGWGLDYFHADGEEGKVASAVREEIVRYMSETFPSLSERVKKVHIRMPWRRMFETEAILELK